MKRATIIQLDTCNLFSIENALQTIGADVKITTSPDEVADAEYLILPGVGSFQHCVNDMHSKGLFDVTKDYILKGGRFLGVCVGMQMMMDKGTEGTEGSETLGLGVIKGEVVAIDTVLKSSFLHKVPHIGWYRVESMSRTLQDENIFFNELSQEQTMFFVHSYMATVKDQSNVLANYTELELSIPAIINYKNAYGFQFHPEKSGETGLKLLNKFLES